GACFQQSCPEAELAELVEHVQPGEPRADHDHVVAPRLVVPSRGRLTSGVAHDATPESYRPTGQANRAPAAAVGGASAPTRASRGPSTAWPAHPRWRVGRTPRPTPGSPIDSVASFVPNRRITMAEQQSAVVFRYERPEVKRTKSVEILVRNDSLFAGVQVAT